MEWYEIYLIAAVSVELFLLLSFVLALRAFFARISPLLDKFAGPGGDLKVPSVKQLIGIAGLKILEQLDFSKIAGNLFGGGAGAKK